MAKQQQQVNSNLRKGDDTKNCGLCMNWGSDGKCSLLNKKTLATQVCDNFTPTEGDTMLAENGIMSQLFGGV